jgi:hypothetical protein
VLIVESTTGRYDNVPALSVLFERAPFMQINFDAIDPSDAISMFDHSMQFTKASGFSRIELISPDEYELS